MKSNHRVQTALLISEPAAPTEAYLLSDCAEPEITVSLLTGGTDRHYTYGLATALAAKGVSLDILGGDAIDSPELHTMPRLRFLNIYGDIRGSRSLLKRLRRLMLLYFKLLYYVSSKSARVLHILWNNRIQFFDRVFLMLYYRLLGKKIVLTAHNINKGKRDANDTFLNRLTLKIQYRLADHIFVHTDRMRQELLRHFDVREEAVSVIPYGINNAVPETDLSRADARRRLGIDNRDRAILFFGAIRPSKGLEYLVAAFERLAASRNDYHLIIAGEPKKGLENYFAQIQRLIEGISRTGMMTLRFDFIPDEDIELYFKAADVLALPYTDIYESGVLFLSYNFGLPVVAADVGSFSEKVIEGATGFISRPRDPHDLAKKVEKYFGSELYRNLPEKRAEIREYACAGHSWDKVSALTRDVYAKILKD